MHARLIDQAVKCIWWHLPTFVARNSEKASVALRTRRTRSKEALSGACRGTVNKGKETAQQLEKGERKNTTTDLNEAGKHRRIMKQ